MLNDVVGTNLHTSEIYFTLRNTRSVHNSVKLSRCSSRVKWLNCEWTDVPRTISTFVVRKMKRWFAHRSTTWRVC